VGDLGQTSGKAGCEGSPPWWHSISPPRWC